MYSRNVLGLAALFGSDWRLAGGGPSVYRHQFPTDRGIAQPGSAAVLGTAGRWFESSCPDQSKNFRYPPRHSRGKSSINPFPKQIRCTGCPTHLIRFELKLRSVRADVPAPAIAPVAAAVAAVAAV